MEPIHYSLWSFLWRVGLSATVAVLTIRYLPIFFEMFDRLYKDTPKVIFGTIVFWVTMDMILILFTPSHKK